MRNDISGTDHGPAAPEGRDTSARHARNRELRAEYLDLEAQLLDSGLSPIARRRLELRRARLDDIVMRENDGLVGRLVQRFATRANADLDECRQEGRLALFQAWRAWDPDEAPFASFAFNFVRGAVNRSVHQMERPQVSYGAWTKIPHLRDAHSALIARLGREPTLDELAEAAELTVSFVEHALTPRARSLDAPVGDGSASLYGLVADRQGSPDDLDDLEVTDDLVRAIADHVDTESLAVFLLRTGAAGTPPLELASIASITALDREAVRRRAESALGVARAVVGGATVPPRPVRQTPLLPPEEFVPSAEQVIAVRDDVLALVPATVTASRLGLTAEQVIGIARDFGTWLSRSRKDAVALEYCSIEEMTGGLPLLQRRALLSEKERREARLRERESRERYADQLRSYERRAARAKALGRPIPDAPAPPTHKDDRDTVYLPAGYVSRDGRNINRAVGTLVEYCPDDATVRRYLARRYPSTTQSLCGETVFVAWRLAQLGRLDDLTELHPRFAATLVEARDQLELAVTRAREARDRLLAWAAHPEAVDRDELERTISACAWLAERDLERVRVAAREGDDVTVERALRALALAFRREPLRFAVPDLATLREGQVRRIAEATGLRVDGGDATVRRQARAELVRLGLAADIDKLLPEAVAAAERGSLDEYLAIVADAEVDTTWRERVDALLTAPRG